MSLFVAVVPPARACEHLHDALTDVRRRPGMARVRWTSPDRWHITLAFLGDPPEHVDEDAAEALQPLTALPAITGLQLTGAGSFGRTVLWIGVGEGSGRDALATAARRIPSLMRGTGAVAERREWRPHLTVGRLRGGSPDPAVTALAVYRGPTWDVDEIHLIRSTGGPTPVHHRITTLPLQGT